MDRGLVDEFLKVVIGVDAVDKVQTTSQLDFLEGVVHLVGQTSLRLGSWSLADDSVGQVLNRLGLDEHKLGVWVHSVDLLSFGQVGALNHGDEVVVPHGLDVCLKHSGEDTASNE